MCLFIHCHFSRAVGSNSSSKSPLLPSSFLKCLASIFFLLPQGLCTACASHLAHPLLFLRSSFILATAEAWAPSRLSAFCSSLPHQCVFRRYAQTTSPSHALSPHNWPREGSREGNPACPCLGQYGQLRDQNPRQEVVNRVASSVPSPQEARA